MYEELNLKTFKAKLADGGYVSSTGALRAIGKAKSLSDADKDKARKAVAAHFGDAAPAKKPEKAAKKAAKKLSKKVAAKVAAEKPVEKTGKRGKKKVSKRVAAEKEAASEPKLQLASGGGRATRAQKAESTLDTINALNATMQSVKLSSELGVDGASVKLAAIKTQNALNAAIDKLGLNAGTTFAKVSRAATRSASNGHASDAPQVTNYEAPAATAEA